MDRQFWLHKSVLLHHTVQPQSGLGSPPPQLFTLEGGGPPRAGSRPKPHLYMETVSLEASVCQHFINASLHLVLYPCERKRHSTWLREYCLGLPPAWD